MENKMTKDSKNIQHLWWRAAFGIKPEEFDVLMGKTITENVDLLFAASKQFNDINVIEPFNTYNKNRKDLSAEDKKLLKQEMKGKLNLLNASWLLRLASDEGQFRERMVFFWHNHFACRSIFPHALQKLNNITRQHALEHFGNLLQAVSKTPAMLMFLNNQQNKKEQPNENFARELMELFTIGRGNYTEQDVKEAARAFTGWSFDIVSGDYVFRPKQHDSGKKTFMGQSGNFTGEEIIQIILSKRETASFLVKKIYKEFVNDTIDTEIVNALADDYFSSDYHTGKLMRKIFTSDWFYNEKNIGTKIKSPVELITGLNRTFKIEYNNPDTLMFMQRLLGQQLFLPPNVSGWPGGRNWIDCSSLMLRLRLPSLILNDGIIDMDVKEDDDTNEMMMTSKMYDETRHRVKQAINASTDWSLFFKSMPRNITRDQIADRMLMPSLSGLAHASVETTDQEDLKTIILELLSLPEYQLC